MILLPFALSFLCVPQSQTPSAPRSPKGWPGFGSDPQHQTMSKIASQPLDQIRWTAPVDLAPQYTGGGALLIHYGSPLSTRHSTIVFPVKTGAFSGFEVQ